MKALKIAGIVAGIAVLAASGAGIGWWIAGNVTPADKTSKTYADTSSTTKADSSEETKSREPESQSEEENKSASADQNSSQDTDTSSQDAGADQNQSETNTESYEAPADYDQQALLHAMHLDTAPYENVSIIADPDSLTLLVNKYNQFPDGYMPSDLTDVPSSMENGVVQMRAAAAQAFTDLVNAGAQEGIIINACSAFRSQEYQAMLFNNGRDAYGLEYADAYWTRPGFSEHQSGLAVDIRFYNDTSDLDAVRNYPQAYAWLLENMADYGFILRYPQDGQDMTLIAPESWHLRYVGQDLARYLMENNLTLDEYYGLLELNAVPSLL